MWKYPESINTLQLGEHEIDNSSATVDDSEASAPPMDDSPAAPEIPVEQPPVPAPRKSK